MKIGGGECDVSQARHLEAVAINFLAGHVEAAEVGPRDLLRIRKIIRHRAERRVHISANTGALMAGNAAVVFEELVALFFLVINRIGLAAQVTVKGRVRREERSFKGRKGILDRVTLNTLGVKPGKWEA